MAAVTADAVMRFLGSPGDSSVSGAVEAAITAVTAFARAYTRGRGFASESGGIGEPNDEIAAVIVTASARLAANPEQVATTIGSVQTAAGFQGWSLAELSVLNRYRVRAQ